MQNDQGQVNGNWLIADREQDCQDEVCVPSLLSANTHCFLQSELDPISLSDCTQSRGS